jgi:drug/metabolite transporter (DMT)-like permease
VLLVHSSLITTFDRLRLPLVLGVGILAVSFASILIKFALAERIPPLVIAASRLTIASAVIAPLAWSRSSWELRSLTRVDALLAIVSGVFLALHFAFWISSFNYTSVMSSVVLAGTNPLFVALASLILLREPLTRPIWFGILVGVILLAEPVGATLLAVPLLKEVPSPLKLFGGALVLSGIFIATRGGEPASQPATVEAESMT